MAQIATLQFLILLGFPFIFCSCSSYYIEISKSMMKPLHCKHSECATTERSYASIRLCIEGLFENEQTCITTVSNCFDMMKPLHCKHNECARTERSYASIELCIKDLFRNEQSHIATVSNCCEMKTKFTFSRC